MKKAFRFFVTFTFVVFAAMLFTVLCSAEKKLISEGYCVRGQDGEGNIQTTNIKWAVYNEDGTGVIYFNIDKSLESENTVLYARQKDGNELVYWDTSHYTASPWGEYTVKGEPTVTRAVIGEGITEINGAAFCGSKIATVEMPKTVTALTNNSFARMSKLTTVNITGETAAPNVIDLKYVKDIGTNTFEAANSAMKYILSSEYSGELGFENFKENTKLGELEIPKGVTMLGVKLFNGTNNLARLIIRGKNTEMNENTFEGMEKFPRIVGYIGSKAEAFAKANGYTFIDIETDKEIHKGTKPLAEVFTGVIEDPFVPVFEQFDPKGATAHGHMTGMWEETKIVDTYWAYYSDTKTLKLFSAVKNYNETGNSTFFDDKTGWSAYTEEIEHVILSDYIYKLSDNVFSGMKNLRDVELSRHTSQMNSGVFKGCSSLTTVYYRGKQCVEGQADFSESKLETALYDTGIRVLKLGEKNTNPSNLELPDSVTKIITPLFNDTFDSYCKANKYDLQDANNAENIKIYHAEAPAEDTTAPPDTTAPVPEDTEPAPETTLPPDPDTTNVPDTTNAPDTDVKPPEDTEDTETKPKDTEPADITSADPDETSSPESVEDTDPDADGASGGNALVIVIITAAVLVAAGAATAFVIVAKKYLKK